MGEIRFVGTGETRGYPYLVCKKIPSFNEGTIDRTGAQTMLYLTCTIISNVDLARCGVYRTKDWVSVDCGTLPILVSS